MGPERRLRYFIYARIIVAFLFLASTIFLGGHEQGITPDFFQSGVVRLMAFSFIFSVLSHGALRLKALRLFVIYLQSIWDVLFVTLLLLFTGGILSPYSFLYLLSIMNAGVLLGRREALYTASLCAILYGAMVDFQYFGLLQSIGLSPADAYQMGESHLIYIISLHVIGFASTGFITGYLSERARESEAALRATTINYEELAQMNSMIVANIETGLLTTNRDGRVRAFNPYAEHLTGIPLEEAYDMPFENLFPELTEQFDSLTDMVRGEFGFVSRDGLRMTFGFSSVPLGEDGGTSLSIIFNFRDVTAIRRMEETLKRSDRLAALGEISARMAHEIRNPLAALCGSAQMLEEQGAVSDNSRRLLSIVVRESQRLNKLISDFLAYARPNRPRKCRVPLRALVDDLKLLLPADSRFSSVEINNLVSAETFLHADPDQMHQVLMNLFSNSADAMPEGGVIEVTTVIPVKPGVTPHTPSFITLVVTDTGPGIDAETTRHLYEPFWTTKPAGTGLGLAIVYRLVEAHGGKLRVENAAAGGCRVSISIPL